MCGCVYGYNLSLCGGDPEVHQRDKDPPVRGRPHVFPGEQQEGSMNPQESRSTMQLSCEAWRMLLLADPFTSSTWSYVWSSPDFSSQHSITCLVKKTFLGEEPWQFLPHSQHYLTLHALSKCIELIDKFLKIPIWNVIYLFNKSLSSL